jgi:hypothetical protein
MDLNNLIDAIQTGDVQDSNNEFNGLMSDKINVALDTHKQELAGQMYGTADKDADEDI